MPGIRVTGSSKHIWGMRGSGIRRHAKEPSPASTNPAATAGPQPSPLPAPAEPCRTPPGCKIAPRYLPPRTASIPQPQAASPAPAPAIGHPRQPAVTRGLSHWSPSPASACARTQDTFTRPWMVAGAIHSLIRVGTSHRAPHPSPRLPPAHSAAPKGTLEAPPPFKKTC